MKDSAVTLVNKDCCGSLGGEEEGRDGNPSCRGRWKIMQLASHCSIFRADGGIGIAVLNLLLTEREEPAR
jgi:hypothetical protein